MKNGCIGVVIAVAAIAAIIALTFLSGAVDLAFMGWYGPQAARVERSIQVERPAFIDSANQQATNSIAEYERVNTLRIAAESAGKKELAAQLRSQMQAIATSVCKMVEPMMYHPANISAPVRQFINEVGCTGSLQ